MERKSKKTVKAPAPQGGTSHLREGDRLIGPGVVKRAKRDPAEQAAGPVEVEYTPSEQVFRRRS